MSELTEIVSSLFTMTGYVALGMNISTLYRTVKELREDKISVQQHFELEISKRTLSPFQKFVSYATTPGRDIAYYIFHDS